MNYKYRARDKYGKPVSGVIKGDDKSSIAKHLSSMGYIPISIEESRDIGLPKIFQGFNKVTLTDVTVFTRQLLTLQKSGIPLLVSLGVIENQMKNKYFKDVIKEMAGHVAGGLSLSDALAKYPGTFNELYVNMVKAGEASGSLDEILGRLAEFGEKEVDTNAKIKSATRYPIMALGALFFAFVVLVSFVFPKFASVFSQYGTALPIPTRMLLGLSFFMQRFWYIVFIVMGALVYLSLRYINTKDGRLKWDALKLKMPVFGPLVSMFAMSRFSRTMAILIRSGLPIMQVLDMASRTVGNVVISRAIDNITLSVKEGKGISEPMKISGIFPPMVTQMVAVGEDTGKIDELLMQVADYYDQQSSYMIANLTTMMEPVFVMILAVMVLVVALSIFLPMWNLVTLFRH